MDPFTISLAFGCLLTFSQIDQQMTEEEGQKPDGIIYKSVALIDANGRKHSLESSARGQGFSPGAFFDAGPSPDQQFASYVVFMQAAGQDISEVRFVSAKTCQPVRFVNVKDGSSINAGRYEGWLPEVPHTVRILQKGQQFDQGLPIDEAKQANPAIKQ